MASEQKVNRFCQRVSELRDSMFAVSMSILNNEADAEDAIQRTLLNAYEHLDDLKFFERFKPWLFRILTNECYKIAGSRKYHEDIAEAAELIKQPEYDNISSMALWECIMTKEESYRTVIVLFYYESMRIKEIAAVLQLSEANVKKRLSRGRDKLKEILEREEFHEKV